jgi:3'-5' exoribonuclease
MATRTISIVPLDEMTPEQEADMFVLLVAKEELTTKTGKPYHRVTFRGGAREIGFPIWADSPWAADCRAAWTPGVFYKLRAVYRETNYGPQLEIRKIREVVEADAADGFDPAACQPRSRFDPQKMFEELETIVRKHIEQPELRKLVESILCENRNEFIVFPAARHNHHAFTSGLLEHTLSVTKTALYLSEKYADYYPDMQPPLDKSMVVAGAILHDIGKLREYESRPEGAVFSAEGAMIGHMLQGRDIVREAAARMKTPPDAESMLRLEHAVIAHQRLPEWGSPKPPMTPEAMLIHYADDIDAKFNIMVNVLRDDTNPGPVTSRKNPMAQHVFRGAANS